MMKNLKYILLAMILFPLVGMVSSCSEESADEEEFGNWEQRNEAVISQWGANSSYKKIVTYSKELTYPSLSNKDFIYVEVLESGAGTESPLFTDTVRVAYRGHLIPTASYPEGYVFDQTYTDEFDWSKTGVSSLMTGSFVDGFSTALMNMHKGDRWRVRIPYSLAYGTSGSTSILGYSNLVFDIALYDFWHPGEIRPGFKSRGK